MLISSKVIKQTDRGIIIVLMIQVFTVGDQGVLAIILEVNHGLFLIN